MSQRKLFKDLGDRQKRRRLATMEDDDVGQSLEAGPSSIQSSSYEVEMRNVEEARLSISSSNSSSSNNESFYEMMVDENIANVSEEKSLKDNLAAWAIEYNIPQNALTALLKLLHISGHSHLSLDGRTLLQTPISYIIKECNNGQYLHNGLVKCLNNELKEIDDQKINDPIAIDINIDGLPLAKSSKSQLWPILGRMPTIEFTKPFLIGAFHGHSKPSNLELYLKPLIEEYMQIKAEGFLFNGKKYTISIRAVICDTPARSFITATKGHNAYFGCSKCTQEGVYENHRMLFPDITNVTLRSDKSFKERQQEEHHTGISPFEQISLGMVSQFPLDYMHLVCLGVTKKLLNIWLKETHPAKFSGRTIQTVSTLLSAMREYVPLEFCRKPRALNEIERWKATEFRMFLMYIGPFILKDNLPEIYLQHFMLLHCSVRILCHPEDYHRNNAFAKALLLDFVNAFSTLYGKKNIVYSVHNLIHLSDEALSLGNLDSFSCFPFENYLQQLKKMLRKSDKPLAQLFRRLGERAMISQGRNLNKQYPHLMTSIREEIPMQCIHAHTFVCFKSFTLSSKKSDNCCLMKGGDIVTVEHIGYKDGIAVIIGRKFLEIVPLKSYPCNSANMDIYEVKESSLGCLEVWPVNNIVKKMFKIPYKHNYCLMPLLHSEN